MVLAAVFAVLLMFSSLPASGQVLDVRELHPSQIAALDRSRTVVLLTGGILEEHGPFLPSYSDGYQTEFVASRLAEAIVARPGWVVLRMPPVPLGTMPASEIGGRLSFPGSYGVRSSTLRAVFMDLATDLGDAGFRWGFIVNLHGSPTHNRALDDAAQYFVDTFGGRMVHLSGLASVAGAVPRDIFSPAQRNAEGFSVHADADEHSRLLFLRPDLVRPDVATAAPVIGRNFADLVTIARKDDWPGYWGTPAIATAAAGARAMNAIAQAAVDVALKTLDGAPDAALPRVANLMAGDPDVASLVAASLERERQAERRQTDWLARHRQ
ncbi:MAG TPA: creatininase family protein [Vicinamibacterales bacterium]|jgi:creatinine amidohydrolase/Fe(II)-dependent formamide hydrolase-like protein